jgi:CubicO group peptidase (beta-lactamase class C family)
VVVSAAARRERVEHGLLAALQIAGRPAETFAIGDRMLRYAVPGAAVAVVDDGEISWASGYGVRRAGSNEAVHATTLFQAASISKAVSAVVVLALVEAGDIGLDDDVNRHLRSWQLPASAHTAGQPVTLRHLLSHTAGTTVPGFPGYPAGTVLPDVPSILSGTGGANTPAVESFTTPGSVTQYSGGGTTIVQLLITEVTGRPFDELIRDLVLAPFGMVDSAFDQPPAAHRAGRTAVGHDDAGRPTPGDHHVYPELQAAGLWTTAVDLGRWVIGVQQVLRGDRTGPISRAMAELMITEIGDGPFGLGPEMGGDGELRRFGHSGGNEGFRSQVDGLVHRPVGAAILTNANGGTTLAAEIRRAVAAEYGWGPLGAPPLELAEVDPALLASYAGSYVGPFDRPMKLRFEADADGRGELFSPAPYGRRRMLPLGPTTFLDEETGATLEVHATDGAVERIAVLVDGAELMAFAPRPTDQEHS